MRVPVSRELNVSLQKYSRRLLQAVHAKLNISEKEWDAMVADFKTALGKFKLPMKSQEELLAIAGSSKGDIVTVASK